MQAKALIQADPLREVLVAPVTPALEAILHTHRSPVVADAHDPIVLDDDRAHGPLHTVRTASRGVGDFHEVVVETRAELAIHQIAQLGGRLDLGQNGLRIQLVLGPTGLRNIQKELTVVHQIGHVRQFVVEVFFDKEILKRLAFVQIAK